MRNIVIALFCFLAVSCQEGDPVIPYTDPFVGSWYLSNPDLDLEVTFDVTQDGKELSFENINIEYPEITGTLNYHVELFDRFPVNTGFGEIKIFGISDQQWIVLIMDHNRIHRDQTDELLVYNIQIEMVNRLPVELDNQVFIRND